MATLKEYFDTDFKDFSVGVDLGMARTDGTPVEPLKAKVMVNFAAGVKFSAIYLPATEMLNEQVNSLTSSGEVLKVLEQAEHGLEVQFGTAGFERHEKSTECKFTNRIHLYVEADMPAEVEQAFRERAKGHGLDVVFRDLAYAKARAAHESPLAFISHDSRDKEPFVRSLALELFKNLCPVWYDEFSLKPGDSLRASIDAGLKQSSRCVLVLSKNFMANEGWGKAEFDSIFTREIIEKRNVILPVWLGVTTKEVYDFNARMVDRVGVNAALGVEEVARQLVAVIKAPPPPTTFTIEPAP